MYSYALIPRSLLPRTDDEAPSHRLAAPAGHRRLRPGGRLRRRLRAPAALRRHGEHHLAGGVPSGAGRAGRRPGAASSRRLRGGASGRRLRRGDGSLRIVRRPLRGLQPLPRSAARELERPARRSALRRRRRLPYRPGHPPDRTADPRRVHAQHRRRPLGRIQPGRPGARVQPPGLRHPQSRAVPAARRPDRVHFQPQRLHPPEGLHQPDLAALRHGRGRFERHPDRADDDLERAAPDHPARRPDPVLEPRGPGPARPAAMGHLGDLAGRPGGGNRW